MKIFFHRNFEKKFKKLNPKIKKAFQLKLKLFSLYPFSPELNNHTLKGRYASYRSINITGDIRAIFIFLSEDVVEFDDIDSHSNLYK
ncbi:MAG: type II toxin-antitoxin system YafQ family toxin [Patescibacteria group bacterium]